MNCVVCGKDTGADWKHYCHNCWFNRKNPTYVNRIKSVKMWEIKPQDGLLIRSLKYLFQPTKFHSYQYRVGSRVDIYPRVFMWIAYIGYSIALLPIVILFFVILFPSGLVENKFNVRKTWDDFIRMGQK